jgi:hypothetical protein
MTRPQIKYRTFLQPAYLWRSSCVGTTQLSPAQHLPVGNDDTDDVFGSDDDAFDGGFDDAFDDGGLGSSVDEGGCAALCGIGSPNAQPCGVKGSHILHTKSSSLKCNTGAIMTRPQTKCTNLSQPANLWRSS